MGYEEDKTNVYLLHIGVHRFLIFVFPMYIKMSGKELAFNKCALKLTQSTLAKAQVRNFKQQPALNTR